MNYLLVQYYVLLFIIDLISETMISPVSKDLIDREKDRETKLARPEWMKWYYHRWSSATQLMDAEQKGWYMNLLMYAAIQGEPAGYLPDDEEELMLIAEAKDLHANAYAFNKRWLRVRNKFKKSTENIGFLYNKMLLETLSVATKKKVFTSKAADARWDKHRKEKELNANALQTHSKSTADANAELDIDRNTPVVVNTNSISMLKELDTEIVEQGMLGKIGVEKEKDSSSNSKRKRKKSETPFDKENWSVTDEMKTHLINKYEGHCTAGDIKYLNEKFQTVHADSFYTNWTMAFYNFVDNQVMKYNYKFGKHDWKALQGEQNGRNQNSVRDREADELIRRLRGGGSGNDKVNPPGLSFE